MSSYKNIQSPKRAKIKFQKMKRDEKYALMAGIAVWIEDNKDLVEIAQRLSHKTLAWGLCDTNNHHPFQIIPTDVFDGEGNVFHDLVMHIDHAAWGYFQLKVKSPTEYELVSPKLAPWPEESFASEEEAGAFIEALGKTLDDLYSIDEIADDKFNRNWDKMNALLDKILSDYRTEIDPLLVEIKAYVDSFPRAVIYEPNTGVEQFANATEYRYDLALLHPENWYVKKELTESDEEKIRSINEKLESDSENPYIVTSALVDEEATEALLAKLREFHQKESRAAAFPYMAQKLLVQKGYQVEVATDSAEGEPDVTNFVLIHTNNLTAFVRPVLHATDIRVTDGPKAKNRSKSKHFGVPLLD